MEWKYKGYRCELIGASYNCPGIKLYGYPTPSALERAIDKKLRQIQTKYRQNGPIWEAVKRGGRIAYRGYRHRRLEGKLARARAAEEAAYRNPRAATGIPGRVVEVRYARGGRDPGRYVHRFGPNVRFKLGPGRSRVQLYHARGEPIWADERGRDFDKWVDLDHHRRMNPRRRAMARRRRRSSSRSSGISTQTWLLIGIGAYLWYTGALNRFVASPATGTYTVPSGAAM